MGLFGPNKEEKERQRLANERSQRAYYMEWSAKRVLSESHSLIKPKVIRQSLPLQLTERPIDWQRIDGYEDRDKWLVVTDRRIPFLEARWNFSQKDSKVLSECQIIEAYNLEDITSASGYDGESPSSMFRNWFYPAIGILDKDNHIHKFSFFNVSKELAISRIDSLVPIINDAIVKCKAVIQEQQAKSVVVDFSWVREYLDKGGLLVTTVKCPQCGASIELPKEGNLTKCQHCGSQVYAQDVFDKLKGLLK